MSGDLTAEYAICYVQYASEAKPIEIEDLIAECDKVVARWTMHATNSGSFMGMPPTGKQIAMSGITIYRLANGQISEARSDLDQLGLLQQLGVIPTPGKQ